LARGDSRALSVAAVLRRYYAISLAYALAGGFLAGVYPLFLQSRGLDQFEINSVLAVYFAVTFVTDLPTGAFADALSRRRSFVLGCVFRCLGFALYFVSHAYLLFLVAETIDAVGTTFCNGAVDAWGVDALDEAGFARTKHHLFSRISQLSSLGFMVTAVIGAAVASVNIAWPWLLGAGGFAVSGFMGAFLHERRAGGACADLRSVLAGVGTGIGRGIRRGFGLRSVRLLSLAEGIILAAWAPYWLEWPLLFKDAYGVGVWIIGWIFCVLVMARMVGAEIVARATGIAEGRSRVLGGLVIGAGGLLIAAGWLSIRPTQALIALLLMNVCLGAREPLANGWFNAEVAPEERATMLSFRSTMATAGGSLGLLLGGYVVDLRGISFHWRLAGTMALLAVPCYLRLNRSPAPSPGRS